MIDDESNKNVRNKITSKDSKKEYHYQVFNDKDQVNDAIQSINYWIKNNEKTEIDNEIVISVTGGHVLEYDDPEYNVVLNSFENIIKILIEKINPILITSFYKKIFFFINTLITVSDTNRWYFTWCDRKIGLCFSKYGKKKNDWNCQCR